MTKEWKINAAKTVQELQLYPYRSKSENVLRGIVWIASWIIGIAIQQVVKLQALGGAYIIFAVSLLLEFFPESRSRRVAKIIHSIFCLLLIIMLLGALVLSFADTATVEIPITDMSTVNPSAKVTNLDLFCSLLAQVTPYVGWIVCVCMFISIMLALTEMHKLIYDSEANAKDETETGQNSELEQFISNLQGKS